MKESILHNVVRCSKCGEHYYKCRGVSDTRCESCSGPDDDEDYMHSIGKKVIDDKQQKS